LFLLPDSCTASLPAKIALQITCPNPSPKPFSQSRKIVNLWPGQIPGKGKVQLYQGYKEKPLLTILCSHVCSAVVNTCLYPFDQGNCLVRIFSVSHMSIFGNRGSLIPTI
jgi:hypothetical protein